MILQELIVEILEKGININGTFLKEVEGIKTLAYKINGFYKSSSIDLYQTKDGIFAEARYNEITKIESFNDLVNLNYNWWYRGKNYYSPSPCWFPYLLELGLIKKETKTITSYK